MSANLRTSELGVVADLLLRLRDLESGAALGELSEEEQKLVLAHRRKQITNDLENKGIRVKPDAEPAPPIVAATEAEPAAATADA